MTVPKQACLETATLLHLSCLNKDEHWQNKLLYINLSFTPPTAPTFQIQLDENILAFHPPPPVPPSYLLYWYQRLIGSVRPSGSLTPVRLSSDTFKRHEHAFITLPEWWLWAGVWRWRQGRYWVGHFVLFKHMNGKCWEVIKYKY